MLKKNIEYIKIERFKRIKQIHYDGQVSYTDWKKISEEMKQNILPRKLMKSEIERKTEKRLFLEDLFEFNITDFFERTINIFNDETVDYGEWRKVNTKGSRKQIRPGTLFSKAFCNSVRGYILKAADYIMLPHPENLRVDNPANYYGDKKTQYLIITYVRNKYIANPSEIMKCEVLYEVIKYLQKCSGGTLNYVDILEDLQHQQKIPYDSRLSSENLKDAIEYMKKAGILSMNLKVI